MSKRKNQRNKITYPAPIKSKELRSQGNWAPINLATVWSLSGFNGTDIRVYLALAGLCNLNDGYAFPRKKHLLEIVKCDEKSLKLSLKRLCEFGFIRITERSNSYGGNKSNKYEVFGVNDHYKNLLIPASTVVEKGKDTIHGGGISPLPPGEELHSPSGVIGPHIIEDPILEDFLYDSEDSVDSFSSDQCDVVDGLNHVINHHLGSMKDSGATQEGIYSYSSTNNLVEPGQFICNMLFDPDNLNTFDNLIGDHFNNVPNNVQSLGMEAHAHWCSLSQEDRFSIEEVYYAIALANEHILHLDLGNYPMSISDIDNCAAINNLHRESMPNIFRIIFAIGSYYDKYCDGVYPLTPGEALRLMREYSSQMN